MKYFKVSIILIILFISCKTSSIHDYRTNDYKDFLENYNFSDNKFDKYRNNGFLMFASIVRTDYSFYELSLVVYSLEDNQYLQEIKNVEIVDINDNIVYSNKNIISENLPQNSKNNLFVTYIDLIKEIPQKDLTMNEYIIKISCENKIFHYNFNRETKTYMIMP
jgi:hypothetical protein